MNALQIIDKSELIVIKIGTALVAKPDGSGARAEWLSSLAEDVLNLRNLGKKVVLVSSGAVALGRKAMGIKLTLAPSSIPLEMKQASSAVGQYHLFHAYQSAFAAQGLTLAQVLLTMSETENRRMHLNARATLKALLDKDIIPVINENDTVSTGEIRFGDNDRLAARVGQMLGAECIILLSTIDGLYTANPDKDPNALHVPFVAKIEEKHSIMGGEAVPGLSTGGMKSKVEAAKAANLAGIHLIIANGRKNHALKMVFEDIDTKSTVFLAENTQSSAKKRWISSHLRPMGAVFLDLGAVKALNSGKSLLPVGVSKVEGNFERGDVVEIFDPNGVKIAMGIASYNAHEAIKIAGKKSEDLLAIIGYIGPNELIHRNDLVMT